MKALTLVLFITISFITTKVSAQAPSPADYICTYNGKAQLSPDILCDSCRLLVHNKKGQTFSVVHFSVLVRRYGKVCIYPCFGNKVPKDKILLVQQGGGVTMLAFTNVVIINRGKEVEISGPDPYLTKAQ